MGCLAEILAKRRTHAMFRAHEVITMVLGQRPGPLKFDELIICANVVTKFTEGGERRWCISPRLPNAPDSSRWSAMQEYYAIIIMIVGIYLALIFTNLAAENLLQSRPEERTFDSVENIKIS